MVSARPAAPLRARIWIVAGLTWALAHSSAWAQREPAPAAEPVPSAPGELSDDPLLATLDLDDTTDERLRVYGFTDVVYYRLWTRTDEELPFLDTGDSSAFAVGNINIYLAKNLSARWRTLAEVRLLISPHGDRDYQGNYTDTNVGDPVNGNRPIDWGGIRIERAHLDYDVHPLLTIRVGHWLTPYGIWNIDHGSPTIIPVLRPYAVGEQYLPEHQTGIELFGATYVGEYRLGYHATLSNGRSSAEAIQDPDSSPAYGRRVQLTAPWAGTLTAGASVYYGKASQVHESLTIPHTIFTELSYAADVSWQHEGFLINGEAIGRERRYRERNRARAALNPFAYVPDGRDYGGYLLAAYRFTRWWNVTPYVFGDYVKTLDPSLYETAFAINAGFQLRPVESMVLKLHVGEGFAQGGVFDRIGMIATQASWVF